MQPWRRTLYITCFAQFTSAIGFAIVFPFLPLYVQELGSINGWSTEFLSGMAYTSVSLALAFASPIWGTLSDRYGRKPMVIRSMLGGSLALLLMGFARSAEELIILRGVQGLITGTILATNALVISVTPREHSGYAMGMMHGGFWSGIAIGPLIGGFIADTIGFRFAFAVASVLLLIGGIVVTLGVKEHFVPQQQKEGQKSNILRDWRNVLQLPGVLPTYGIRFFSLLGPMLLLPIFPFFAANLLEDPTKVSTFVGVVIGFSYATGTLSSLYLGRLSDKVGQRRLLIASLFVGAVSFVPQAFVHHAWQLLLLQIISGAAMGGISPLINALLANYTSSGKEGIVYGLDQSVSAFSRASSPLLGAAVAFVIGYSGVFVASAVLLCVAGFVIFRYLPEQGALKVTS